ncbi:MAG: class I SAM-dependent methyltransferase [Gemmatimonadota bacterium]|jgi:SAM-dependent methyltransferase
MNECRACRSERMHLFLEMGEHPAANGFLKGGRLDDEPLYPLNAHACLDCGLIQVPDVLPPDFFRHYVYIPSASDTMHAHFRGLAGALVADPLEGDDDLLVDIGCNDGLFLAAARDLGARTLGIDPARNIAEMAREKGLEVFNEYFGPETAAEARKRWGPAKVIVTTNTFNHIGDLHAFMEGVVTLLQEDGLFVIEVPQALDLVEKNEFDTIYHEHVSEFSVKSLGDLFAFFDMDVVDLERLEIHGGSMRVHGRRRGVREPDPIVAEWVAREEERGLFEKETYDALADRVRTNRDRLLELLEGLRADGRTLAGYGAPAKGTTLLNYFGIGPDLIPWLADRNPLKQGLYSPGMHIPVVSPDRIEEEKPDYLLILAWNFADEIMGQQEAHRRRGGRFIIPIPEPEVIP